MSFVEPPLLRVDETILALVRRLQQAHRRERRQRLFALPARRRSHEKLARLRRNDSRGKLKSNTKNQKETFMKKPFSNRFSLHILQRSLYNCQESAAAYKDLDLRGFDPDAPDSDDDPISDIEE